MHLMLSMKVDRTYVMMVLLGLLFILFVFNAFLATQLEGRTPYTISEDKIRKLYITDFPEKVNLNGLPSDASNQYKIWKNILAKEKRFYLPNPKDATIATQCSVTNLYHIIGIFDRWHGRISVAVFAPGPELMLALKAVAAILLCLDGRIDHTSFHIVIPLASPPENLDLSIYLKRLEKNLRSWSCPDNLEDYVKSLSVQHKNYETEGLQYPVNLLRNVALGSVRSSHSLVIDIDMVPNAGFYPNLVQFLMAADTKEKTVYVVPAFEVKKDCELPSTKLGLLKSWEEGCVRPFYYEQCWKCQKYTQYDKWAGLTESKALIAEYEATWHDPWEPFFVGETPEIHYDERFKQYGFNRISQVCELHMAGFRFWVLNNAFLLHKGFKETGQFHKQKEADLNSNRILYRQFKNDMIKKYPVSSARC